MGAYSVALALASVVEWRGRMVAPVSGLPTTEREFLRRLAYGALALVAGLMLATLI